MQLNKQWYTKPYLGVPINWEHDLAQGLVGCWLFNEGGGGQVYDLSDNNNHGTLTNMDAKTDWVPGKFGKALDFKNTVSEHVLVGTINHDIGTGDFAWEAFIKADSVSGFKAICCISSFDPGFYVANGDLQIYWGGNYVAGGVLNVGEDYHVAFSRESGIGKFYINGRQTPNSHDLSDKSLSNATFRIGSDNYTDDYFDGMISFLRFWTESLDTSRAQQLSSEPFCMFEYPSVAEYFVPATTPSTVILTNPSILMGLMGKH